MPDRAGLRERKKAWTRRHIADTAARLIAERGYDAVAITEVAREADVSEQTVYNYFPAKQDLVLDRVEEIRGWYDRAVRSRRSGTSPAEALAGLVSADIDRYRECDLDQARGEFPAQCVASTILRRFALEEREQQARVVADAITATTVDLPPLVAHAHAAALIALVQAVHDRTVPCVLEGHDQQSRAEELHAMADEAFSRIAGTLN